MINEFNLAINELIKHTIFLSHFAHTIFPFNFNHLTAKQMYHEQTTKKIMKFSHYSSIKFFAKKLYINDLEYILQSDVKENFIKYI